MTTLNVADARGSAVSPPGSKTRWGTIWTLLPVLLVALPLAYGSFRAFPLYDDGWMSMLIRESGLSALAGSVPDRPVFGILLTSLASLGTGAKPLFVIVTSLLWIALAWATGALWRSLVPELGRFAPAAACMAIAPIVATCQLTTVVTSLQIVPCALGYLAVLLLLRFIDIGGPARLVLAALAIAGGALFSEYILPVSAVGFVLLLPPACSANEPPKRALAARQALLVLSFATVIGYLLFLWASDTGYRPTVSPTVATATLTRNPLGIGLNLMNGTWRSVLGAYGAAISELAVYLDSKSTVLAAFYGLLSAAALTFACKRGFEQSSEASAKGRSAFLLVAATAAGLLPVALMNRSTVMLGFGSRFLIPILPIAAVATLSILLHASNVRARWAVVGMVGLISGNAALMLVHSALQEHQLMTAIGQRLKSYVEMNSGYTAAVVDRNGIDYEFTAKSTLGWGVASEKRFWLFDENTGRKVLGARQACNSPATIAVDQRRVARSGPLSQLIWVETRDFKVVSVEPYCRQTKND